MRLSLLSRMTSYGRVPGPLRLRRSQNGGWRYARGCCARDRRLRIECSFSAERRARWRSVERRLRLVTGRGRLSRRCGRRRGWRRGVSLLSRRWHVCAGQSGNPGRLRRFQAPVSGPTPLRPPCANVDQEQSCIQTRIFRFSYVFYANFTLAYFISV